MKQRFLLVFVIFIFHLGLTPEVLAGRRLDLFLEKYNAVNGRMLPMAHADSPFYRYYDRDFEEGLDESQRVLLREAQEEGNCILVNKLLVDVFLSLFPP